MFRESEIRERLIMTMHSSNEDKAFFQELVKNQNVELLEVLVNIAGNQEDYGDAPIAASLYIKDYSSESLRLWEHEILDAFQEDDRYARLTLAIALAKLNNSDAKSYIFESHKEIPNDWRISEAVEIYNSHS